MESLNIIITQFNALLFKNPFSNFIFDERGPLHFLVLIISSFFAAYIIDIIFIRFLSRIVKSTKSDIDDIIIEIIHTPLKMTIQYFGILFVYNIYFSSSSLTGFYVLGILNTFLVIYWDVLG